MLTQSVAIYMPSRDRNGHPIADDDRADTINIVQGLMAERFGGFTQTEGIGGFNGESGLIRERVSIIRSWVESIAPADVDWLRNVAADVAEELNQESVAIEIPGGIDCVAAPAPFRFVVA
jgi:hypothetical protein